MSERCPAVCVSAAVSLQQQTAEAAGSTQLALAGDQLLLTLTGCDAQHMRAGSVLCEMARPAPVASRFRARLVVLDTPYPVTRGFPVSASRRLPHSCVGQSCVEQSRAGPLLGSAFLMFCVRLMLDVGSPVSIAHPVPGWSRPVSG